MSKRNFCFPNRLSTLGRMEVVKSDGSTHTFYYNYASSLLLQKISEPQPAGPDKVWYPICQQFDANARVILDAVSFAVESVDEGSPTLFTLKAADGLITVIEYDNNGNLLRTSLCQGLGGSPVIQRETPYDAHVVNGVPTWVPSFETVYREATDPVTTFFAYEWHQSGGVDTAQMSKRTTTLPAVPGPENGDDTTATVVENYDEWGFLYERVDEMGVSTTYERVHETGAIKKMVQDAGGMNLTTDYESDALGRITRTLGPEHTISLEGAATAVRRAEWTQYLDAEDEVRSIQGYVKTDDNSEVTINPVQIHINLAVDPEVSGGSMTQEIAAVYAGAGVPPETHTYNQSDWVRWSTQHFDAGNEQTHSRVYHLIPGSGPGSSGTNYAQTDFAYDSMGRQNQVTSPEGTIQRSVFNAMGWQMETQVGTSDTNLVTTAVNEYDGGADQGDGNLTTVTQQVDGNPANDRVQHLGYDWRNRRTGTEASDGTHTILSVRTYDNLGNVTQMDEYQTAVSAGNLINRAASFFDARNRLYRTQRYGVDITDGTLQSALTGETYYDQAGRTTRQTPAGKIGFTVSHYDALGRVLKSFRAFGAAPSGDPSDISTSTVLTQTEFSYDDAGNQTATVIRQRFDDATGDGELMDPSTEPKARVSYAATYPDAIGRTQAQADYGTNGGAAWTPEDTVPARSDTVLVSSFVFNDAGDQTESADPMGTVTGQEFDQAGRRVKSIENSHPGTGLGPDINKTTRFEYNLDGNLVTLTAENPTTGAQVTRWIYGVTVAQGSALESNALVYQKIYPGAETTPVSYQYNRQGQPIGMADQATTTHAYSYDGFGRQVADAVTNFGPGIDTTVQAITRSYEVHGMLERVSSMDGASTVPNEVQLDYDSYSQLAKDWQAHGGAVDTGTTLNVGYSYADGSDNTVRPTGITYPDGTTQLTIDYSNTDADALSRPDAIMEGGTTLCFYRYLGSGTVAGVKYDAAGGVELTYQDGGTGDAGDQYTGLDRFGRLVETLWKTVTTDQVRSKYGRNRFGGVVWRQDEEAHAQSVDTADNYFWYDGLHQVKQRQRGDLTGTAPNSTGIANLQQDENWTYDATGNWAAYSNTSPTNGQTRTHNTTNEITEISSSPGDVTPAHDPVGNMLTLPKAPGTSTDQSGLTWDAWNRLVAVTDGGMPVASYTYDGLTRRMTKTDGAETRHYYYNVQWRAMEERVEGASVAVDRQYAWGLRDRWDLLRRKRSTAGFSLNEIHFCLRDYLDPVAIVDETGTLVERFAYDAFGNVRFLAPDYSGRTGSDVDWDFLFHAEFRDPGTKLYNYGYRYYHTRLGRWQSRDPVADGTANPFIYVSNRSTFEIVAANSGRMPATTLFSETHKKASLTQALLEAGASSYYSSERVNTRARPHPVLVPGQPNLPHQASFSRRVLRHRVRRATCSRYVRNG